MFTRPGNLLSPEFPLDWATQVQSPFVFVSQDWLIQMGSSHEKSVGKKIGLASGKWPNSEQVSGITCFFFKCHKSQYILTMRFWCSWCKKTHSWTVKLYSNMFYFSKKIGSQLTNSIIFQRGRSTTNSIGMLFGETNCWDHVRWIISWCATQ